MLEALSVLEGAKVIHCDLKPENVLLTPKSVEACGPNWDVHSLPPRDLSATSAAAEVAEANNPISEGRSDASDGQKSDGHLASAVTASSSPRLSPAHPAEPKLGLKVIDFGSACGAGEAMYSYIQSRFYRAPEVLLGLPYDGAIDMWSLGCIVAECFLGLPIFPGVSEHNQVCRIAEMLGPTPDVMLEAGKYSNKFYRRVVVPPPQPPQPPASAISSSNSSLLPPEPKPEPSAAGMSAKSRLAAMQQPTDSQWSSGPRLARMPRVETEPGPPPPPTLGVSSSVPSSSSSSSSSTTAQAPQPPVPPASKFAMKTPAEYAADTRTAVPVSKKYFKHSRLRDICVAYPYRRGLSPEQQARDRERRGALVHFLHQVLVLLPHQRLTPRQALAHPFVTGEPMPHVRDLWAAEQQEKEQRSGTRAAAEGGATAPPAQPVEAASDSGSGGAAEDDDAASKAASLARLAKAVDADEDGYYWAPPDDRVLADRALRLLRHNQHRYDAQKKSSNHQHLANASTAASSLGAAFTSTAPTSTASSELPSSTATVPPAAASESGASVVDQSAPGLLSQQLQSLPVPLDSNDSNTMPSTDRTSLGSRSDTSSPSTPRTATTSAEEGSTSSATTSAAASSPGTAATTAGASSGGGGGSRGRRRRSRGGSGGGCGGGNFYPMSSSYSGGGGGYMQARGGNLLPRGMSPPYASGFGVGMPGSTDGMAPNSATAVAAAAQGAPYQAVSGPHVIPGAPALHTGGAGGANAVSTVGFIDGAGQAHPFSFHQGFTERHLLGGNTSSNNTAASNGSGATSDFAYAMQRPGAHARDSHQTGPALPPSPSSSQQHAAQQQQYATQQQQMALQQQQMGPGWQPAGKGKGSSGRRRANSDASGAVPASPPRAYQLHHQQQLQQQLQQHYRSAAGGGSGSFGSSGASGGSSGGGGPFAYQGTVYYGPPQGAAAANHPIWGSPMTAGHYMTAFPMQQQQQQQRASQGAPMGSNYRSPQRTQRSGSGSSYYPQQQQPPQVMLAGSPLGPGFYAPPQNYGAGAPPLSTAGYLPPSLPPQPPAAVFGSAPPHSHSLPSWPASLLQEQQELQFQAQTQQQGWWDSFPERVPEDAAVAPPPRSLPEPEPEGDGPPIGVDEASGQTGIPKVHSGLHQQLRGGSTTGDEATTAGETTAVDSTADNS